MKNANVLKLGIQSFFDQAPFSPGHKTGTKPVLYFINRALYPNSFIKNTFKEFYHVIDLQGDDIDFSKVLNHQPDAVIIDISVQYLNGIELCKKFKNNERTNHLPVVLFAEKISNEQALKGLENGCDDYITKKLPPSLFITKMSNLINTRRLLNSNHLNDQGIINNYKNPPLVDSEFTRKAYDIIEENIDNPAFEVSDFVKAIGMSRAQLYRKINGVSGLSVKEFIRIIRLKKAAGMLTQTHYNISEIAYKVGFNSIAYFTRSFGEYYGLTPSKYKNCQ